MADGEVKINTKLDTSGLDKGLKDLKTSLKNLGVETSKTTKEQKDFNNELDKTKKKSQEVTTESKKQEKSNKSLSDTLKGIKSSTAAATAGYVAAGVAIKKTVDALNDCEAAYKVQLKAETALANAAKNNPYLNNESVYNLRAFASELQSMSEIGDEQSLQVMAQLAAMGRTEEQIQAIMKAAADMSAVTGNSIQNIAVQLNKTYSGLSGELGEANSAIRALSKEELEAGKAIDIIAQQYNGSAAAMADNTVQLANAWGDFKENIGRNWAEKTSPIKKFFTDTLNDINEALALTADKKAAAAAGAVGKETAAQAKLNLDEAKAVLDEMNKNKGFTDKNSVAGFSYNADWEKDRDAQAKKVEELTRRYNFLASSERYEAAEAERNAQKAAAAAKARADAESRDKDAQDFIDKNKKALAEQLEAMRLRADLTGEEIDAGEMYNAYLQSYIDLVTKSNGLVTENNTAAKARLALLEQWAQKAKDAADAEQSLADKKKAQEEADALLDKAAGMDTSIYDKYISRNAELLKLKEELNAAEIEDEKKKADEIAKIDEEMAKNRRELWANVASEVTGYAQQVQGMIDDAAKMALKTSNNEMKSELANLEIKYRKGELGEEEYQKKVAEAKKKGAKIQYQIEMAQWAANILTATANTAVGVTQALAQGGVAGIITGALVGAAGAVQLASIMAAKPIQHFATGGFVGGMNGATMGGDNEIIAARRGELTVNATQQARIWRWLNGGENAGVGAGGVNLTINNSAANMVNAQPQISRNEIEIMIDARVNDSLKNGRYNSGLNAAQAGMSGEFYGM
jgi:hypothetical protein